MNAIIRAVSIVLVASVWSAAVSAQQQKQIPIRQVAPIEATSTVTFTAGNSLKVWQRADGSVAVAERVRAGKLTVLDAQLGSARVVADSSLVVPLSGGSFVAMQYPGDTIAVMDGRNAAVLLLDRDGKQQRVSALPRAQDASNLGNGAFGNVFDPQGRLLWRGLFAKPPAEPGKTPPPQGRIDSTAILRADFAARKVDTIGALYQDVGNIATYDTNSDGKLIRRIKSVPNVGADDWAMLSDGTVAIVRHQDYHLDWVFPDGKRLSTPKMPFDWRRFTDVEKQTMLDSLKAANARSDSVARDREARQPPGRPGAASPVSAIPERTYPTLGEINDYYQPIRGGNSTSVIADADGHLWILPLTSSQAQGGLLYDVVNTKGEIIERVQLPANAQVAGFGSNGVVFLRVVQADKTNVVSRTHIVR